MLDSDNFSTENKTEKKMSEMLVVEGWEGLQL